MNDDMQYGPLSHLLFCEDFGYLSTITSPVLWQAKQIWLDVNDGYYIIVYIAEGGQSIEMFLVTLKRPDRLHIIQMRIAS